MKTIDDLAQQVIHISRKKELLITSNEIRYATKKWGKKREIIIPINEIVDTRYGIEWLSGLRLVIGRRYIFRIRTEKQLMRISFISLYRVQLRVLNEKFIEIYEKLWECYWSKLIHQYFEKLKAGETILLSGVSISKDKVIYDRYGKKVEITAGDVAIKRYQTHMMIFDKKSRGDTYLSFHYKDDWNAVVIDGLMYNLVPEEGGFSLPQTNG